MKSYAVEVHSDRANVAGGWQGWRWASGIVRIVSHCMNME